MRYWPVWAVADAMALAGSPFADEVKGIYRQPPSEDGFYALITAAQALPAVDAPNLVIIESEGAPNTRAFTAHPDTTEWLRLERCTVMQTDDGYLFAHMERLQ